MLRLRSRLALWLWRGRRLALLLGRSLALLLLLGSGLALLLWHRSHLTLLLLLRSSLALLLLRSGLALLLRLGNRLTLLLLLWRSSLTLLLWHRNSLTLLLLLLDRLMLLLLRNRLSLLLLLRSHLTLLLLLRFPLPLLQSWICLPLLLLLYLRRLPLFLSRLALLRLLRNCLARLLLRGSLIVRHQCRWGPHIVIRRKRLADRNARRTAMIDTRKLSPIRAGCPLILHLRRHGRRMRRTQRRQFRRSRSYLDSARPAVEAHTSSAPVIPADGTVVDVMLDRNIHVVDRAVVVEVAATPVTALIAEADVAKAVIDAAVVANVLTPVAAIETVVVMPVAPVAGRPQSALVGSLHPNSGHPVVVSLIPCPVARRPEIVVSGNLWLIVVRQRRRRLVGRILRLLSVARIFHRLFRLLGVVAAPVRWRWALLGVVTHLQRSALLIAILRGSLSARVCGRRGHVGRRRIRRRVLRGCHLALIRFASCGRKRYCQGNQRPLPKSTEYVHFTLQYA